MGDVNHSQSEEKGTDKDGLLQGCSSEVVNEDKQEAITPDASSDSSNKVSEGSPTDDENNPNDISEEPVTGDESEANNGTIVTAAINNPRSLPHSDKKEVNVPRSEPELLSKLEPELLPKVSQGPILAILVVILAIFIAYMHVYVMPIPIALVLSFFRTPIDGPIFRDLANTTNTLVVPFVDIQMSPSSLIIDQRVNAHFLSKIIIRTPAMPSESQIYSEYLIDLGDALYETGTTAEKLFNIGIHAYTELEREYTAISDALHPLMTLSFRNCTFFSDRTRKILGLVTKLRDRIGDTIKRISDTEDTYRGVRYGLQNGFKDLESFLKSIEDIGKQKFDWFDVTADFEELKQNIPPILEAKEGLQGEYKRLDEARRALIKHQYEFLNLIGRKYVSEEDSKVIAENLKKIQEGKEKWRVKDTQKSMMRKIGQS